ncbi:hypothetical protein EQG49_13195 [Periweissella cryptocerci]|uniref:Uncharacterized protein n=1 Tax=Periweissella cryptocerci TaxID=2506420 RepID=A0A4P6YWV4_9LACO|nr:hypothetical protein [Periweissella cryptocerci]QBO37352.1 hypothetical protein EQG49_13195 [Periweissella cryptocerci]
MKDSQRLFLVHKWITITLLSLLELAFISNSVFIVLDVFVDIIHSDVYDDMNKPFLAIILIISAVVMILNAIFIRDVLHDQ